MYVQSHPQATGIAQTYATTKLVYSSSSVALALSSSTTLVVLSLRGKQKEDSSLLSHGDGMCRHTNRCFHVHRRRRHRRDTSLDVHCTSPLELVSSCFLDSALSFPKSRGVARSDNPQCEYSVYRVEHPNELEPHLLSEDGCDKLVLYMIVTPLRSQVTRAKWFTMPISPVLTTLLRGRACSWFATLACCLEMLYADAGVEGAENDTVGCGLHS
jgi:hypothetical protein